MERKSISGLTGKLLALPIAIATAGNLGGCIQYGGKQVKTLEVYDTLKSDEPGGSEKIANILDHDRDGDIDKHDAEYAKPNLQGAAVGYWLTDNFRRGWKWLSNRKPLSLSDNVGTYTREEE